MILQDATWQEVERYLGTRSDILIPVGSTEQHGPTGPIGTDAICAEAVAGAAADRCGALVAPTLAYGQAQFNLAFPGTISITAVTQMRLVTDIVGSLADQGFTHFYFVNGHGGNRAPIEAAIQDIYHQRRGRPPIRCRLRAWWEFDPVNKIRREAYGAWEGIHATPSELSIAIAQARMTASDAPTSEDLVPCDPVMLQDHAGDRHLDAASHRDMFPDGRIGSDPWLATQEAGERLLNAAAEAVVEDLTAFRKS